MTHCLPLAIVAAASAGIGFELAQCGSAEDIDLLIAANQRTIEYAAAQLRQLDLG
jgi:hypothetical protein